MPATTPRRGVSGTGSRGGLLHALEISISPLIGVLCLWALSSVLAGGIYPEHMLLSLACFALTFPGTSRLTMSPRDLLLDVVLSWGTTFGLLWMAGLTTGYVRVFRHDMLLAWTSDPMAIKQR